MTCHVSHLSSMPEATEIAGDGAHIHPYVLGVYSGEGDGTSGPWGRRGNSTAQRTARAGKSGLRRALRIAPHGREVCPSWRHCGGRLNNADCGVLRRFRHTPPPRQRQKWRSKWKTTRRQWRKGRKLFYPQLQTARQATQEITATDMEV